LLEGDGAGDDWDVDKELGSLDLEKDASEDKELSLEGIELDIDEDKGGRRITDERI